MKLDYGKIKDDTASLLGASSITTPPFPVPAAVTPPPHSNGNGAHGNSTNGGNGTRPTRAPAAMPPVPANLLS